MKPTSETIKAESQDQKRIAVPLDTQLKLAEERRKLADVRYNLVARLRRGKENYSEESRELN